MTISSFLHNVKGQQSLVRRMVIVSALALAVAIGAEGPIAHWNFDERSGLVAADVSGNGHTGTLNGVYWHNDLANGAIYCDGSGHVAVQDAPSLRLIDALTLTSWVRIADPTAEISMRMISKKIAWDSPQGFEFEYNPANNVLSFTGQARDLAYALVDLDTSWHHLAAVIDGPTVRLYVDGAPVPMQDDRIGALQAGSQPLTIGRHSAGGGQFDGAIDDVRMYRRALAASEIRALLPQFDKDLVAHWDLDESAGTVANDRSKNALHGVLTAGADWFPGPTSGAVYLDGAGHVAIPDSSKLRLTQAMTIMAWARVTDPQQASYQRLVSKKYQWDDADGYELLYNPARRLLILGAGGDNSAVAEVDLGSDWHHITATISGTAAQLYVDGKALRMEDAVVGSLKGGKAAFSIGRTSGGGGQFDGGIDDVRIYGLALSGPDIAATLFASSASAAGGGAIGAWNFNETSGAHVLDASGNEHHGSLSGVTRVSDGGRAFARFDGTDDVVTVAHADGLSPTGGLTIAAWIRIADPSQPGYRRIVSKKPAWDVKEGFSLEYNAEHNVLVYYGGGDVSAWASVPLDGGWHHIVAMQKGTQVSFYLDGSPIIAAEKRVGPLKASTCALTIGSSSDGYGFFQGDIDDVQIFGKAILPGHIDRIADRTPPTVPSGLSSPAHDDNSIALTWAPSSDNVALAGYLIMRDGVLIRSIAATALIDDALNANTAYEYTVTAIDASGNRSSASAPLVITTSSKADAPPTIVVAAAADPNPVTGTTAVLSVLGEDDAGQPALTYTWATTGTPPAPVAFSANGTNEAKSTVASFTQPGSYTLQCTIRDGGGLSVVSSLAVSVVQTLTTIAVTPNPAQVIPSSTQQFSASGNDQFGTALTIQPAMTWSATGGEISPMGLFTAGLSPGTSFTVMAANSGTNGSAEVTVLVVKTVPSVAWPAPASITYGTALSDAQLNATASVAGTWAYSPAAGTLLAAGQHTLSGTFTPTDEVHVATTSSTTTLQVNQATPTITWANPLAIDQGTPLSVVQLEATAPMPGTFAYAPALGTVLPAGNHTLTTTFTPADVANYVTATAQVTIVVSNHPPTVATAAAAMPTTATGSTTTLSILGADDGGEPSLTYTWVASGPAPVTFSASGTNAAKSTTASFVTPGDYDFMCTLTDADLASIDSIPVAVTVVRTATAINITPSPATVPRGDVLTFTASAQDQFGVPEPVTWALSDGGTIDAAGTMNADIIAGTYAVSATALGTTSTTTVAIVNGAPTIAIVPSATPNPVTGTTAILRIAGGDDIDGSKLTYTWSATGPAPVIFSTNGTSAAKTATATFAALGAYRLTCAMADTEGGLTMVPLDVSVISAPTFVITPASADVPMSGTQKFTASDTDQFQQPLPFTWTVDGGGTVDAAGLFTAGTTSGGPYLVTATYGGRTATAEVLIAGTNPRPVIVTAPAALPATVTGTTTALSVLAEDDGGEANLTYQWFASGPASVDFSVNGTTAAKHTVATFTAAGTYALTARVTDADGGFVKSQVSVQVVSTLVTGDILPNPVAIGAGGSESFSLRGIDQFGAVTPTSPVTWSATAGAFYVSTYSPLAWWSAPYTSGPVTITASLGSWSTTTTVTVDARPTISGPAGITTTMGEAAVLPFTIADTDAGQTLALVVAQQPRHGTITAGATNASLVYTPDAGFVGSDRVQVQVSDGLLTSSSTVTVPITVTWLPVAGDILPGSVVLGRNETCQMLLRAVTQDGTVFFPTSLATWSASAGTIYASAYYSSGAQFYAPSTSGPVTITARLGTWSVTTTVAVDARPTISGPGAISTMAGVPLSIPFTLSDIDAGQNLTVVVTQAPTHGTITPGATASTLIYSPQSGYGGSDQVTVAVSDGLLTSRNVVTVPITVSWPPSSGEIVPGRIVLGRGESHQFFLRAINAEGDVYNPSRLAAWSASAGTITNPSSYLLSAEFYAPQVSGPVTITAQMGTWSTSANVTVDARPNISGPGNLSTPGNTAVTVPFTLSDDDAGQSLSLIVITPPRHGTLTPGATPATLVYTPAMGFAGIDTLVVTGSDGLLTGSYPASVSLTVVPGAVAPVTGVQPAVYLSADMKIYSNYLYAPRLTWWYPYDLVSGSPTVTFAIKRSLVDAAGNTTMEIVNWKYPYSGSTGRFETWLDNDALYDDLPPGQTYRYEVVAWHNGVAFSVPETVDIIIPGGQDQVPNLALNLPRSGDIFANEVNIDMRVTLSGPMPLGASLIYLVDGNRTFDGWPPEYKATLEKPTGGTHTVQARLQRNVKGIGQVTLAETAPITITVRTAPPVVDPPASGFTIAVQSPSAGQMVRLAHGATIGLSIATSGATPLDAWVEYRVDGNLVATGNSPGNTAIWSNPSTGGHTITASLRRYSSTYEAIILAESAAVVCTVQIDQVEVDPPQPLPTVALVLPDEGDRFVSGARVDLAVQLSGPLPSNANLVYLVDNIQVSSGQAPTYATVWSNPTIGTHTLKARIYQYNNYYSPPSQVDSAPITFTVLPESSISVPVPVDVTIVATEQGTLDLSWKYALSQVVAPVTMRIERWRQQGSASFDLRTFTLTVRDAPSQDRMLSWSDHEAAPGITYWYRITASLPGGWQSAPSAAISGMSTEPIPVVVLTAPYSILDLTRPASVSLAATIIWPFSAGRVEFLTNGRVVATCTAEPYVATWVPSGAGTYAVQARAIDPQGRRRTSTAVTIVARDPVTPPDPGQPPSDPGQPPTVTPPVVTITSVVMAAASRTGDLTAVIDDEEWALSKNRIVDVEVTSEVIGGTITGGSVTVGGTTVSLTAVGGTQTVSVSVPDDGRFDLTATVNAQDSTGTAMASAVTGDGISCDAGRALICAAPPTISAVFFPAADGVSVDMELPAVATGKLVLLNGNPEDDATFGNKQLRETRQTPFFSKSAFKVVVAVDAMAGISRNPQRHTVTVVGGPTLTQLTQRQGDDGRFDRLIIAGWDMVPDSTSAAGADVQALIVDACGNVATAVNQPAKLFTVYIDAKKPILARQNVSEVGDLNDQVAYSSPLDRVVQTGVLAWQGGAAERKPALEAWDNTSPDGSYNSGDESRGMAILPTALILPQLSTGSLWFWYDQKNVCFGEYGDRMSWGTGFQMPYGVQDQAGNFSEFAEADATRKQYSIIRMPIQGQCWFGHTWQYFNSDGVKALLSGPANAYQASFLQDGRLNRVSSYSFTFQPGIQFIRWNFDPGEREFKNGEYVWKRPYKGYSDLRIFPVTTVNEVSGLRSGLGKRDSYQLGLVRPRDVEFNSARQVGPAIIQVEPSWQPTDGPGTTDISIRDSGVIAAMKLFSGTPSVATPRLLVEGGDKEVSAVAYDASTGFINGKISVRRSDWTQTKPGAWTLSYGVSGSTGTYNYTDHEGYDKTGSEGLNYNNKGYRWLNAIRVSPDVVATGSRTTITIDANFVDKNWDWKDFSPIGDYVHFHIAGSDVTLKAAEATNATPEQRKGKIAIVGQRFVPWVKHPTISQALELDIEIDGAVPAVLADIDVMCGAVKAYSDTLSQTHAGANGSHRMKEALAVLPLDLKGGVRFGSIHKATVVPLPTSPVDFKKKLGATHLFFPKDCLIDASAHQSYGLIRAGGAGVLPASVTVDLVADDGAHCVNITEFFQSIDSLVSVINFINAIFGYPAVSADGLKADLIAAYGIPQDEVGKKMWWMTPTYTSSGKKSPIRLKVGGKQVGDPIVILVKQPLWIESVTASVARFGKFEAIVHLDDDYFHHRKDGLSKKDQFDAYDADKNGEKIIVDARFRLMSGGADEEGSVVTLDGKEQVYNVPCFAMKESDAATTLTWKVRFSPPFETTGTQFWEVSARAGVWHQVKADTVGNYDEFNQGGPAGAYYHYYGYNDDMDAPAFSVIGNQHKSDQKFYTVIDPLSGQPFDSILPKPRFKFRVAVGSKSGPLEVGGANPHYFHHQQAGPSGYADKAFFVLGGARPWVVPNGVNPPPWGGVEGLDRQADVYAQMAATGMNFNYTWFAPWETQMLHQKQAEFWYLGTGAPVQKAVPADVWRPELYYDQGRGRRMDEIVEGHEANNIYMALTVWAHQSLQATGHDWGEVGWKDLPKAQENNGLNGKMTNDQFFASAADENSTAWLYQKDYYRYIVARYGYSRALAMWVTIDELEGVGNSKTYWFNNLATTNRWHDVLLKTIRELDYRKRPSTASTTYWNATSDPYNEEANGPDTEIVPQDGGNHGGWNGGAEKPEVLSAHVYHNVYHPFAFGSDEYTYANEGSSLAFWKSIPDQQALIWHYLTARMHTWPKNTSALQMPKLVTEIGFIERKTPADPIPEAQIRSFHHFAIWAAFANGQAGTPLKWCDGKSFGELFPRNIPAYAAYPNLGQETAALKKLVSGRIDLSSLTQRMEGLSVKAADGNASSVRAFGLSGGGKSVIWLFDDDFNREWGDHWGESRRTYADNQRSSKQDHVLIIPGITSGSIKRFGTWDGSESVDPAGTAVNGALQVRVGDFSVDPDHPAETWDGADVVLIIE